MPSEKQFSHVRLSRPHRAEGVEATFQTVAEVRDTPVFITVIVFLRMHEVRGEVTGEEDAHTSTPLREAVVDEDALTEIENA